MGPRQFLQLANDQTVDQRIRQLMLFHGLDTKEDSKTQSRQPSVGDDCEWHLP